MRVVFRPDYVIIYLAIRKLDALDMYYYNLL